MQACIYLNWMNAAHKSFPGRKVVVLNLDETSIAKAYSQMKGTVMLPSAWPEYNSLDMSEHVNKNKTRCHVSYCAIVASDPLISERLPQVLLASRKNMSRSLEQHADVMLGVRTHLWVRDSAWMTQEIFLEILDLLVDALEPYHDFFEFILVFDASRVHFSMDIAQKLWFAEIRIVVVPAKLTWLLQPLDTHVFANFKNNLRKQLQHAALNAPDGQLNDREWIKSVAHCISQMTSVNHARAFHRNGMMGHQIFMKAVESKILPPDFVDNVGNQTPSLEDVKFCLSLSNVPWYEQVVGDLRQTLDLHATGWGENGRPRVSIILS